MSADKEADNSMSDKPKNFGQAWSRVFSYMGRYKTPFIVAIIMATIAAVLHLVGPNLISKITDLIKEGLNGTMDFESIGTIAMVLVIIYTVSLIVNVIQGYMIASVTQKTAGNLRDDIAKKINRIPLRYFDSSSSGDLMSRVTNDVDTMGQQMNNSIGPLVSSAAMFAGALIMMAITNLTLTAVSVLATALGFVAMIIIMKKSQKYFNIQQKDIGIMNGHVSEIFGAHNVVKVYNGTPDATVKFNEINDRLMRSGYLSQFLSGLMMPLMNFIGNVGYVAVCVVGAAMVLNGDITIGVVVAFMMYIRLFTEPLQQISQALAAMQSVAAGAERVFGFLDETELEDESAKTKTIEAKGHVEFKDIRFGYVEGKEIIHGFSADVKPGQKVAIVGPTGAGKTTMVNLLMRFYEINGGEILIDGVSTKELTRKNIHDQFCMVLQETWLFEGTIKENIVYSREGVSDEEVAKACEAVGLSHFIKTLPDGYNTVLKDSESLSSGQRQQLTIARAMIDKSPMLILDEATSSVDTRTEIVIQNAMDKLASGRTSFVIAHRLSTIKNADLILVMKDGNVVEQGTHDELLALKGLYFELYDSQFRRD